MPYECCFSVESGFVSDVLRPVSCHNWQNSFYKNKFRVIVLLILAVSPFPPKKDSFHQSNSGTSACVQIVAQIITVKITNQWRKVLGKKSSRIQ